MSRHREEFSNMTRHSPLTFNAFGGPRCRQNVEFPVCSRCSQFQEFMLKNRKQSSSEWERFMVIGFPLKAFNYVSIDDDGSPILESVNEFHLF